MKICTKDHDDEICYDSMDCPLCEALGKVEDLETENEGLQMQYDDLLAEMG